MKIKILLVCEGPTDFPIIEAVGRSTNTAQKSYEFQMLEPHIDATSGTAICFGWTEVCNWCKTNHGRIQMFLDFAGAVALFIQMDTDIASKIDPSFHSKGLTARDCCETELNDCLRSSEAPDRCHYILPTQKTETWLLATHDNITDPAVFPRAIVNYEHITDVDAKLIAIGYPRKRTKFKKILSRYSHYGAQIVANLTTVRARCPELEKLCATIVSL